MSSRIWTIIVAVCVVVAAGGGYWYASTRGARSSTPSATTSADGRKVLYWRDPMVPNAKFDKPGKSPFMDMQLQPVYADDGKDSGINVSGSVSQSLGIRLGKVERLSLPQILDAVGSVAFDETRARLVQARVDGYVSELLVRAPMVRVSKGQPLARLTLPTWLAAEEEYTALLASPSARLDELRSAARERLHVLGVSDETISDLKRTGKVTRLTTIASPIDGVVAELGTREGGSFAAGATLFRINGLDTVWVNAQIPEAQVRLVPTGATVTAHATAWPGISFDGRVIALLPEIDSATRTFTVRTLVRNSDNKLSPGMFLSIDLAQSKAAPQLVVPNEAVIRTGKRNVVITSRDDGSFGVTEVSLGGQAADKTVILSGLEEGESIVLSGQFLIDSEASLTSTLDRLTEHAK